MHGLPQSEQLADTPSGDGPDLVYDLRRNENTSDAYYADISWFSDVVLAGIELRAGAALESYSQYLRRQLREATRSRGEYAMEALTLGMALSRYLGAAESTARWGIKLARTLYGARRRWPHVKPSIDTVRAVLGRFLFAPRIGKKPNLGPYSVDRLVRLIEWLLATGEFEQEAARLKNWQSFLAALPSVEANRCMESAAALFVWFQAEAFEVLGCYTEGVSGFLSKELTRRGCREDLLFCARPAVEYHLNMVAAEVMNRGLRAAFNQTRKRAVLVPACMRGARANRCQAKVDGVDMTCTACDPDCTVSRITREMRSQGAAVYLVPHSAGFSRWLERWQREPETGVTAVACMLNILPGGYEMRARQIASQCVPLDYPGCQKHWRREGIPTGVNEDRLVRIVSSFRSSV
jgi:hypothetical protein